MVKFTQRKRKSRKSDTLATKPQDGDRRIRVCAYFTKLEITSGVVGHQVGTKFLRLMYNRHNLQKKIVLNFISVAHQNPYLLQARRKELRSNNIVDRSPWLAKIPLKLAHVWSTTFQRSVLEADPAGAHPRNKSRVGGSRRVDGAVSRSEHGTNDMASPHGEHCTVPRTLVHARSLTRNGPHHGEHSHTVTH
ncbi:hypothetical protein EVAR_31373_1 [Eumeta japonica]|uniref:Uncharacterized protein n=1 Tax=Eumeta variegata TaxID=151549 RepID=A0A4C1XAY6_EUMVA|nr:hypothetical protein EVAR_31373_1 [Eumeta japonica]